MFPKKIENPQEVCLYDMITVMRYYDQKVDVTYFVGDDLTLDNIEIKDADFITVIAENPLRGEVYRYHSYGEYWEQIGTVCGYA